METFPMSIGELLMFSRKKPLWECGKCGFIDRVLLN
jgi:hypothetical protein